MKDLTGEYQLFIPQKKFPKLAQVAKSLNITLNTQKVILNKKITLSLHVQVRLKYTISLPDYL